MSDIMYYGQNPADLTISAGGPVEIIRIAADGALFWRGREVHTDSCFRAAMLDLAESLRRQA